MNRRHHFTANPTALCMLFLLGFCPWNMPGAEISTVTKTIPLFNGRDLDGFSSWLVDSQREDPRQVFTVTNGLLRISGDGLGYLATRDTYANYRISLEFKWGGRNFSWGERSGKARDSGLFLHASGPDGNSHDGRGAFMAAIECNVFEGAVGDILLIRGTNELGQLIAPAISATTRESVDADGWPTWLEGGITRKLERWGRLNWRDKDPQWKDAFGFRGAKDVENPAGEWNRLECVCAGNSLTVYLNGQLVNRATNISPSSGKILLQCEGSEIFFRRIELSPPTASSMPDMEGGLRLRLGTDGMLFVPTSFRNAIQSQDLQAARDVSVLIHLHGASRTIERAFLGSQAADLLINVTLPGLSDVYRKRFAATHSLSDLLSAAADVLKTIGHGANIRFAKVSVSTFSAGFGGVREWLKQDESFQRIDALFMADSLYAGYAAGGEARAVDPVNMEGFVRFAHEAAAGRKRFVLTHSALQPEGYASTAETADYLIRALGGERTATKAKGEGFTPATRFERKGFAVFGYPGTTAEAHMDHLRQIETLFKTKPVE